ncbi:hypothetical protein O988_05213 [Pseudogymnoascus sp. VKM F-3808]|nr:hypothetical protein O988_05213 [Pseudogymnoascus sp. VKM F-3808]
MLFTAPLLSLALAALAVAQQTAVFYSEDNFNGDSYTIQPPGEECFNLEEQLGTNPKSAQLPENVDCELFNNETCEGHYSLYFHANHRTLLDGMHHCLCPIFQLGNVRPGIRTSPSAGLFLAPDSSVSNQLTNQLLKINMLFIAPLLSLALATLAAAQEPLTAVFYDTPGYQGSSYPIRVSSESPCYNQVTFGFAPRSAKLSEDIQCFLHVDGGCQIITDLITSETNNADFSSPGSLTNPFLKINMLFIAPLLSLALATLAAAQEPSTAVFYAGFGYQGASYTIDISSSNGYCYPQEIIGFPPRSAKLSEGVRCFLCDDGNCRVPIRLITSETVNAGLPLRNRSVRCEFISEF